MQRVEAITGMSHHQEVAIKGVAFPTNKIPNVRLKVLVEGEYLSELGKLVFQLDSGEDSCDIINHFSFGC